jgi:hypothetical protein
MTHPSSLALESFALGEPLAEAQAAHVEACAACAAFIDGVRAMMADGPSAEDAGSAVARALTSIGGERVIALEAKRDTGAAARATRQRAWLLATSVIAPLAAAAAILLLTRGSPLPGPDPRPAPTEPTAVATAAPEATAPRAEPDTQFKGGMQLAVVRERDGRQERFSGAVRVRPGDRLRVEVALDHEQAILGAVLADDGSFLELMPLGTRGPGTHFSERSAKIDGAVTRGTILVGAPEAVARARATRQLESVGTVRVEWEGP